MANTIAYGLTESGESLYVNEDALYLAGRIKPEMIGGREVESGRFTERTQLFLVSDGFGGPGAGDLAGRLVFQVANTHLAKIPEDANRPFDYVKWIRELMAESDRRIGQELQSRSFGQAGCSIALLFIVDSVAYTMTLGSASLYLWRDNELYLQAAPQEQPDGRPLIHLGKRQENDVPVAQNIKRLDLQRGDQFLLLTDGAYRNVTAGDIRHTMTDQQAFTSALDRLFDLTVTNDVDDNKTMLGVRIIDTGAAEPADRADHAQYRRPSDQEVARLSREHRADVYGKPVRREPVRRESVAGEATYRRATPEEKIPAPPQPTRRREKEKDVEPVKGSLVSTFLKSLLLGFLIGLAIMLTLWFIFLS